MQIEDFCGNLRRGCTRNMIDYCLIRTDKQLDVELTKYLAKRLASKFKSRR